MMARTPTDEQVQVNFRMPADLRDRLKVAAGTNNRSMNAEIVARLDASFGMHVIDKMNELETRLKLVEEDIQELRHFPQTGR